MQCSLKRTIRIDVCVRKYNIWYARLHPAPYRSHAPYQSRRRSSRPHTRQLNRRPSLLASVLRRIDGHTKSSTLEATQEFSLYPFEPIPNCRPMFVDSYQSLFHEFQQTRPNSDGSTPSLPQWTYPSSLKTVCEMGSPNCSLLWTAKTPLWGRQVDGLIVSALFAL